MDAKVSDLKILIQRALDKSGESPTPKGFQKIADEIDDVRVSKRYLYDRLHIRIKDFDHNDAVSLREASLDTIAKYLGFTSYKIFLQSLKEKRDPQLDSCVGSYYSYIRMNAKETVLLQSPVQISYKNGKYMFEQKGARNTFIGEIRSEKGCLFILLESKEGKSFYHTYKIGIVSSPKVMQGIFSGVSSSFDPIGGRAVLMRVQSQFNTLTTAELSTPKGKDDKLKTLFEYFNNSEHNNLSVAPAYTFSLQDLKSQA
jgi:hypothetical protein